MRSAANQSATLIPEESDAMAKGSVREFRQSGALPVIGDHVVLVTARKSGRWIIPKGYVEKGMSPAESAAKEAFEEAGVSGRIASEPIGAYRYRRPAGNFVVDIYPLQVDSILDDWAEMGIRERRIVPVDEALEMLGYKELRSVVAGYFACTPSSCRP